MPTRPISRPYPPAAADREQVRAAIIEHALERIRYCTGYSANCEDAIRHDHEHRCLNDGTTCICACHDRQLADAG